MQLKATLDTLHIPQAQDVFTPFWQENMASMPSGPLPQLDEAAVLEKARWAGLDDEVYGDLVETARQIQDDEALRALWWHAHEIIYKYGEDYPRGDFGKWPTMEASLGPDRHPLFHLLLSCSSIPFVLEYHRAHNLPEDVTRDTCADVAHKALEFRLFHDDQWGTARHSLYWFRHAAVGRLFAVGRFQYMVAPTRRPLHVYRHQTSGVKLALSPDDVNYTADGLIHGEDDPKPVAFTATLVEDERRVVGYPISPEGRAENRRVTLDPERWEKVLNPGDPIMDMHIPAGGGMTLDVSKDSFTRGMAFFRQYFPDRPFKAIMCGSWIFSPQLPEFLKPESNLVRLESEVYLVPIASRPVAGLVFTFGDENIDLSNAKCKTSLQRAIVEHVQGGGEMRLGGMFLMPEDVEKIGTRYYRAHYPPAQLEEA